MRRNTHGVAGAQEKEEGVGALLSLFIKRAHPAGPRASLSTGGFSDPTAENLFQISPLIFFVRPKSRHVSICGSFACGGLGSGL